MAFLRFHGSMAQVMHLIYQSYTVRRNRPSISRMLYLSFLYLLCVSIQQEASSRQYFFSDFTKMKMHRTVKSMEMFILSIPFADVAQHYPIDTSHCSTSIWLAHHYIFEPQLALLPASSISRTAKHILRPRPWG